MDLGLRGKLAVVMASSEGLGFAAAHSLAEAGARLAVCARRQAPLVAAAERLRDAGGAEVFHQVADVSRPGASAAFIDAAVRHFGGVAVDALVNNGGGPPPGTVESLSEADWQAAFELLVLSNLRASKAVLPHMRRSGGSIVNVVSVSVKEPIENLVLSTSLRSAVVGLAKTMSLEWAPYGIRVNNVCPGYMATQRATGLMEQTAKSKGVAAADVMKARMSRIPMGRMGEPRELGDLVAFLASPRASFITGQSVAVDGGQVRSILG